MDLTESSIKNMIYKSNDASDLPWDENCDVFEDTMIPLWHQHISCQKPNSYYISNE